jgi:hypothetical protein
MMTGWSGGVGQANKTRGAYRSRLRNEFAEVETSGRRGGLGLFGPFGAKERSARVTERSVRYLRVREGVGGNRSRVREACGCHRGTGGVVGADRGDGAAERPRGREAERSKRPRGPRKGRFRRDKSVFSIKNSHFRKT